MKRECSPKGRSTEERLSHNAPGSLATGWGWGRIFPSVQGSLTAGWEGTAAKPVSQDHRPLWSSEQLDLGTSFLKVCPRRVTKATVRKQSDSHVPRHPGRPHGQGMEGAGWCGGHIVPSAGVGGARVPCVCARVPVVTHVRPIRVAVLPKGTAEEEGSVSQGNGVDSSCKLNEPSSALIKA